GNRPAKTPERRLQRSGRGALADNILSAARHQPNTSFRGDGRWRHRLKYVDDTRDRSAYSGLERVAVGIGVVWQIEAPEKDDRPTRCALDRGQLRDELVKITRGGRTDQVARKLHLWVGDALVARPRRDNDR